VGTNCSSPVDKAWRIWRQIRKQRAFRNGPPSGERAGPAWLPERPLHGIVITYPTALPTGAVYWNYGKTPTDSSDHWYQFAGAVIAGNSVMTMPRSTA
jgi:hypothetical protein